MFPTRGWLIASRSMKIARDEIARAAELGINHIQLSHSMVHYAEQILSSEKLQKDVAELIARAHKHDIEMMIWTHEMQNVPSDYMVGGRVDLSSRRTWDYVSLKYEELFELLPDLDGIVLTLTETRIRIDDDNEVISQRPPARRLARMISMINDICRKHNARLIVRTFTWVPRTMLWLTGAMHEVPDDVAVMTKESWGDWYQYSPPNQYLGLFGRHQQIMEVDCWGEYAGQTNIPWVSADFIKSRLDYAHDLGLAGAIARVDRIERSTFGTLNEFNTIAFSELVSDPSADLDILWSEWLESRYSKDAVPHVRRALERTNEIVQSVYFMRGIKGPTTNSPTIVDAEAVESIRFWRDFHGQWNPEMAVRAEQLLHPTEETVVSLTSEKDRAISLCDEALADIERAKPDLAAKEYEELKSGFERARIVAVAWRAMTETVYLHKLIEQDPASLRTDWLEEASQGLEEIADDIEKTHGKGFPLLRPIALRQIREAVDNMHSERVLWSRRMGLYISASPAVADITCSGCPEIVAVSAHKEITAFRGDGRAVWTRHTRGERYEYPHYSSPLIVPGTTSNEVRVLAGAADGRLYCYDGTGSLVWEFATGNRIDASPAMSDIDYDGREEILLASRDGSLYCLSDTGERRWTREFNEPIFATPVITPASEIIVATLHGTVACVNRDGDVVWQHTLEAPPVPPRPYRGVPDGRIYALTEGGASAIYASPLLTDLNGDGEMDLAIGVNTGRMVVFDMRGKVQWEAATVGPIYSSPSVVRRGTPNALIVVGSDDHDVHALDTAGRTVWQFETGGSVRSSPVVVPASVTGEECIIIGSNDHRVYVLNADGHELDEYTTGGPVFSSATVADINDDGLAEILIGSDDHRLYAFRTEWRIPNGHIINGCFRYGAKRRGA